MNEKPFTRLTVENNGRKVTVELPYEDADGNDMCQLFLTAMVGLTFPERVALQAMKEFSEDMLPEEDEGDLTEE